MKIFKAPTLSGIDGDAVLREARTLIEKKLDQPSRRLFMQRSLTLGGLSLLTGCSISDNAQVDAALTKISRFNDKVQGLIFSPTRRPTPRQRSPVPSRSTPTTAKTKCARSTKPATSWK